MISTNPVKARKGRGIFGNSAKSYYYLSIRFESITENSGFVPAVTNKEFFIERGGGSGKGLGKSSGKCLVNVLGKFQGIIWGMV